MRVVGRSGHVQDLPDSLAKALIRDGTVKPAEDKSAPSQDEEQGGEEQAEKPKPRRPRKPKTEE